jgi:NAD-dependent oxidoreductase involved in siderophore biosynthesis
MILFINGPINSGKTTVAKLLARKISRVAIVEVDALRNMIEWMPIDVAVPINLENAVAVIRTFVRYGLNVIVPYPLSQSNHEYLCASLKETGEKLRFFTLAPHLETALSDRGGRRLDDGERARIRHHYEIGIHKPSFGEIIDTSGQTSEQTAEIILDRIG